MIGGSLSRALAAHSFLQGTAPKVQAPAPSFKIPLMDRTTHSHPGPGERTNISQMSQPLESYKNGTPYVPKTGVYKLHKGEAVVKKEENPYAMVNGMAGSDKKPPKELKHMSIRKAKSGGHIVEHHFTAPEHHKMEEHTTSDMKQLLDHVKSHFGDPDAMHEAAESGATEQDEALGNQEQ